MREGAGDGDDLERKGLGEGEEREGDHKRV